MRNKEAPARKRRLKGHGKMRTFWRIGRSENHNAANRKALAFEQHTGYRAPVPSKWKTAGDARNNTGFRQSPDVVELPGEHTMIGGWTMPAYFFRSEPGAAELRRLARRES